MNDKNWIFTKEHRRKLSKAAIGNKNGRKKRSLKTRERMSKAKKGKNNPNYKKYGKLNPNWKGGNFCEPYCEQWRDKEYKESIKERDNYTCQNPFCLCDNSNLCVHHINYIKKDCKPDNLITLCKSSNSKANKDRWFWQEIYEKMMGEKI